MAERSIDVRDLLNRHLESTVIESTVIESDEIFVQF